MAKRPAEDDGGAPSSKRPSLLVTPLDIGPATGQDDLDIKVLQVGTLFRAQLATMESYSLFRVEYMQT